MFINLLLSSPSIALVWMLTIFLALTVHEFAHGLVARWRGDHTAERLGRLTLNPLAHIDPWGLVMLLMFGFGWAKPVPYNPYNLKNPKWDSVLVALAGPAANLIFALFAAIFCRFLGLDPANLLSVFIVFVVLLNLLLLLFNLLPVPPLDGSKLLLALLDKPRYAWLRDQVARSGYQIIIFLVILSLFTNFNIFFFITAPAYYGCDFLVGQSCSSIFYLLH